MRIIENENRVTFDVDDTLILHAYDLPRDEALENGYMDFTDAYTGEIYLAKPSDKHIKLLKYYKARGFYIVVHSGNGYAHAVSVIKQLNIEDHVDEAATKPIRYVDDLPCQEWMGGRIYLEKQP